MKKIAWISLSVIISTCMLQRFASTAKPAKRIFMINKDGKVIEFCKTPDIILTESEITPSLVIEEKAKLKELKKNCFNITDFIKPEQEINDSEIYKDNNNHKIEASESQAK